MLTLVTYDHPSPGQLSVIFKLIDTKTGLKYGSKILNPLKYFGDYLRALYNRWRHELSKYTIHIKYTDMYITKVANIPKIEKAAEKHRKELEQFENDLKRFLIEGKIDKLYYRKSSKRNVWRDIEQVLKYVEEARRIIEENEKISWEAYVSRIVSKNIAERFKVFYLPMLPREIAEKYLPDRSLADLFERQRETMIELVKAGIREEVRDLRQLLKKLEREYRNNPILITGKIRSEIMRIIRKIEDSGLGEEMQDITKKLEEIARENSIDMIETKIDLL
ncbi:MAG: hypothetical protein GXO26_08065 [Crenarchaeota archaeon]|nr:hypothetical protein [Thermoproteota archaeon]